jgi:predicted membrane protein
MQWARQQELAARQERRVSSAYNDRGGNRELIGLTIILLGFFLLMNSMNILPFGPIVARFGLPTALIAIGLIQLSRSRGGDGNIGGLFFILFGTLFFLSRLAYFNFSFARVIWPAILIWIGISLVMKRSRGQTVERPRRPGSLGTDETADSSDFIYGTAILGGFNRKCYSQQFRGGDLTAIMGGGKVDLREARMQADEAVLDIFTVMGGMEIQIPTDWVVEQRFTPILGGFEDKTTQAPGTNPKRLALHGTTLMGGISVTN